MATLTLEQQHKIAHARAERVFLDLDTELAIRVLALMASQWITKCERAGHALTADTDWCDECQAHRHNFEHMKIAPPQLSRDPEGRHSLVSFLTRHGCRIGCTYEAEPAGTVRRVAGREVNASGELRVTVDMIGPLGGLYFSAYGEQALEGAFLGLAALWVCGDAEGRVRWFLESLEAHVARCRIRADYSANNPAAAIVVIHGPDPRPKKQPAGEK